MFVFWKDEVYSSVMIGISHRLTWINYVISLIPMLLDERIKMQQDYVKRIVQQKDELIEEKKKSIEKLSNDNGITELNLKDL